MSILDSARKLLVAVVLFGPLGSMAFERYATIHRFTIPEGFAPAGSLVETSDGRLFGLTEEGGINRNVDSQIGCGSIVSLDASRHVTTVHRFRGPPEDGCQGRGGLLFVGGTLFGATAYGGASDSGTIFAITRDGKYRIVHEFTGSDGWKPNGSLIVGRDGNLWGTTVGGGGFQDAGTIYKLSADGKLETVYSFPQNGPLGQSPLQGLVIGSDGALYTSANFGKNDVGTIVRVDTAGIVTLVHALTTGEGKFPGGLSVGFDGQLLGVASAGGRYGLGTLFSIDLESGVLTSLHDFAGGADGIYPTMAPIQVSANLLTGTTTGAAGYPGILYTFQIGSNQLKTLHQFGQTVRDGAGPVGQLLLGSDGRVYGTCMVGGNSEVDGIGAGTVFLLSP